MSVTQMCTIIFEPTIGLASTLDDRVEYKVYNVHWRCFETVGGVRRKTDAGIAGQNGVCFFICLQFFAATLSIPPKVGRSKLLLSIHNLVALIGSVIELADMFVH